MAAARQSGRERGQGAATRRPEPRGSVQGNGQNTATDHRPWAPRLALVALCLGYFMTILDTTIVTVALPAIARSLGAGVAGLQWVVDGYALVFAALLPESGVVALSSYLSGRVTARGGPRRPMVIGLAAGGAGLLALALVGTTTPYIILAAMLIAIGFGMSFTMPAMTAAVMEAAPRKRAGIASAVLNASRQAGGVLGVALLGAFVGRHSAFVPGLHLAAVLAGGAFLGGCALTLIAL